MPDDHSKLVPLLPIPNRTVKRLCADDSADPRVKVGHRQAVIKNPLSPPWQGVLLWASKTSAQNQDGESLNSDLVKEAKLGLFKCFVQTPALKNFQLTCTERLPGLI